MFGVWNLWLKYIAVPFYNFMYYQNRKRILVTEKKYITWLEMVAQLTHRDWMPKDEDSKIYFGNQKIILGRTTIELVVEDNEYAKCIIGTPTGAAEYQINV